MTQQQKLFSFLDNTLGDNTIIALYGPTASGKTALAIEIAKKYNGQIISADSRMVYQGTLIGTATPTAEEKQGIIHHCIGHVPPSREYNLYDFYLEASQHIKNILDKNILPIITGGTNMYMDSIIEGYNPTTYTVSEEDQDKLAPMDSQQKWQLLQTLDPKTADTVDPHNERHFIRKLEYILATKQKYSDLPSNQKQTHYQSITLSIETAREELYTKIEKRVDQQIQEGLINETKQLVDIYPDGHPLLTGIGYKQVTDYLNSKHSKEEMIDILKRDTRRFAKRQLTWLRKKTFDFIISS